VKFTERRPAGTVTEAGRVSTVGTLVDNATGVPPTGAAVASWTVHRALVFGVRVVAEHVSEEDPGTLATSEMSTARLLFPWKTATEITWFDRIVPADNWKVVDVAPCATAVEVGTISAPGGFAESWRRTPPEGAGFDRVAVQVVELDDIRFVLAQTTDDRAGGTAMVSATVWLELLRVAVMVGVWSEVTPAAVALKTAVLAAEATVTEVGTVRTGGGLL
jgi:hypothetical protein